MGQRGPRRGKPEMALRTDPERQATFLDALAETGSLIESARRASPHSETGAVTTFKSWMRDSPEFAARVQEALDSFRDSLIRETVRRGRDGYKRPIFQKGELVGHETVYSDGLLLAELKKHFPEYREKVEHDHRVAIQPSGAWAISEMDLAALTSDQRGQLRGIMESIRDHRREMAAIEHQPGDVIDADYEEVPDENGDYIPW